MHLLYQNPITYQKVDGLTNVKLREKFQKAFNELFDDTYEDHPESDDILRYAINLLIAETAVKEQYLPA